MFADDTFFFEHSNIKTLFKAVNDELIKINELFSANKLSLNVGKTKFSLLHMLGKKIQHPLSCTYVKNKQACYRKNQYNEISRCLIR